MGVRVREKVKGSGEWWVFVKHKGQRASQKVGSQKAAEKVAEKLEAQIRLGLPFVEEKKGTSPTLANYYQGFKETHLDIAVRESTRDSYERNFRVHILPELGHLRLNEITRTRLKDFVRQLVKKDAVLPVKKSKPPAKRKKAVEPAQEPVAAATVPRQPRKLSRPTIRIITSELCALFSHAKEDGLIMDNPAVRLGKFFKQAHVVHEEIEPLTREEVPLFLEAVVKHAPEHYPLFLCAIHTGMRSGEIAGLQWGDVDFKGKFLTVRRHVKGGRVTSTKTDKIRRVDLSDALLAELTAYKKHRREEWLQKGCNAIPEWVFCNLEGKPVEMQNVKNRHFFRCLEKAGLRRIRFHDLRHTFASLLIQAAEPLAYIKDQLGHSSIKMTVDVYGHLVPGANRQAVNRLPSLNATVAEPRQASEG